MLLVVGSAWTASAWTASRQLLYTVSWLEVEELRAQVAALTVKTAELQGSSCDTSRPGHHGLKYATGASSLATYSRSRFNENGYKLSYAMLQPTARL